MPHTYLSAAKMTLKEKIAQLFVMGFRGNDISKHSAVLEMIKSEQPGGVILFDKDMVNDRPVHNIKSPEQVRKLTSALQQASRLPLLIGIDQEGGLINRLKPEYGFPTTQSHKQLGVNNKPDSTFKEAAHIAQILSDAGVNLNFAPCVDIETNPDSIISKRERSFGESPQHVAKHAVEYVKGHQKHQIITCAKHFPGHGSAEGDTHAGFVDVTNTWERDELLPYKKLISEDLCPMIMTAHIFNAHLDADNPATLSSYVLHDLLRGELGFKGVIISDDMQMRAISDHYSLKESLKLGLQAGLDMFCFGNNLLKEQIQLSDAVDALTELVESGELAEERITESTERVLALKAML